MSILKVFGGLTFLVALAVGPAASAQAPANVGIGNPFLGFDLPDDWETRFWASPNAQRLLKLSPKALADLVPNQAGFRYCRCPSCDAWEQDDPLIWSIDAPKGLKCKACGGAIPDGNAPPPAPTPAETKPPASEVAKPAAPEKKPGAEPEKKPIAEPEKKPPAEPDKKPATEETIEVLPKLIHHYPYVELPDLKQHYPGERLYLIAKADYEAREFLSKAALYAAVRYRGQLDSKKDPALADLAAVILLRFAQVYPAYATHFDQPNAPKFLQQADLAPPYRRGYKTAKWDCNGSLDVPLNLVIAYALIRDDPAIGRAAAFLNVEHPKDMIERDLFRASAEFTKNQPEEVNENALNATRGILAVARVFDDPLLIADAIDRLDRFSRQGFYHDGFWGKGTLKAHKRVLGQLDGWIERLLVGFRPPEQLAALKIGEPLRSSTAEIPLLALARQAGSTILTEPKRSDVEVVSWPARPSLAPSRFPRLLGGAGIARLALGEGANGLDVELRDLDSFGPEQIQREALRIGVGGRTILADLDENPGLPNGFDRSSVSHNTVVVDGLNQRESIAAARTPSPGGNFQFFGADPDFQVVTLDDPRSYPGSTKLYRQTVIATAGPRSRYAVSIFEVKGGLQHDQFFHGPGDSPEPWRLALPTTRGPSTLLPPSLTYVANTKPDDDRWFVQSQGEFLDLAETTTQRPTTATLLARPETASGLRLHLLTSGTTNLITARSPGVDNKQGRGSLLVRRRSAEGSDLDTTFVTVFEPLNAEIPKLKRVGRVASSESAVVIYVETVEGSEELVVNLTPGKVCKVNLADGGKFEMDGLAARIRGKRIVLAGGTFAEVPGMRVQQPVSEGTVTVAVRKLSDSSCGYFETATNLPDPDRLAGRTLLITHGDGTTRGWTVTTVQNSNNGALIYVREEPGFQIEPKTNEARYYQFPQSNFPGPHHFRIALIAR